MAGEDDALAARVQEKGPREQCTNYPGPRLVNIWTCKSCTILPVLCSRSSKSLSLAKLVSSVALVDGNMCLNAIRLIHTDKVWT
jgi:hypothetical protein